MDNSIAVDTFRIFIEESFVILAPVLIITFITAVIVGAIMAMMQIQEQTLSFLPKIIVMFAVFYFSAPWMFNKLVEMMREHINNIPNMW